MLKRSLVPKRPTELFAYVVHNSNYNMDLYATQLDFDVNDGFVNLHMNTNTYTMFFIVSSLGRS